MGGRTARGRARWAFAAIGFLATAVLVYSVVGRQESGDRLLLPRGFAGGAMPSAAAHAVRLGADGDLLLDGRPSTLEEIGDRCDADSEEIVLYLDRRVPALGLLYLLDTLAPADVSRALWLAVQGPWRTQAIPIHVGLPEGAFVSIAITSTATSEGRARAPRFDVSKQGASPAPVFVSSDSAEDLTPALRASMEERGRTDETGKPLEGTIIPASNVTVDSCVAAANALLKAGVRDLWMGRLRPDPRVRRQHRLSWPTWVVTPFSPGLPQFEPAMAAVCRAEVDSGPNLLGEHPVGLGISLTRDGRVVLRGENLTAGEFEALVIQECAETVRRGGSPRPNGTGKSASAPTTTLWVDRDASWQHLKSLLAILVRHGVRDLCFAVAERPRGEPEKSQQDRDAAWRPGSVPPPIGFGESYLWVRIAAYPPVRDEIILTVEPDAPFQEVARRLSQVDREATVTFADVP